MDGLVLVLVMILNPRSKAVQRGERMSRDGASDGGDSSGDHGGSTAQVTTVMSASGVQDNVKIGVADSINRVYSGALIYP